ncbi:hypothetical protein N657DRAFT_675417 [Parathielavia appendiculata]|uniref:Uncharacterized protein n=1 Tax=Parathielavia appendiculata TaxID=2587402 RepID=A0AAN6YZP5_9PEZI|nr:hypothetical protein N657DRAFT_675417 [Parathielavia appendiculata]
MRPLFFLIGLLTILSPVLASIRSKWLEILVPFTISSKQFEVFGTVTIGKNAFENGRPTIGAFIQSIAKIPSRISSEAVDKLFADPYYPKISELAYYAQNDPLGKDGKPLFDGKYDSEKMVGIKGLGHGKVHDEYAKASAAAGAKAKEYMNNPAFKAMWDVLDRQEENGWQGGMWARDQDVEDGRIRKVSDLGSFKPGGKFGGLNVAIKSLPTFPGTAHVMGIDYARTFLEMSKRGGTRADMKEVQRTARQHTVVETKKNDGRGHDRLRRDIQKAHSSRGSPADGC